MIDHPVEMTTSSNDFDQYVVGGWYSGCWVSGGLQYKSPVALCVICDLVAGFVRQESGPAGGGGEHQRQGVADLHHHHHHHRHQHPHHHHHQHHHHHHHHHHYYGFDVPVLFDLSMTLSPLF